jgi:hypothetical protein
MNIESAITAGGQVSNVEGEVRVNRCELVPVVL